MTVGLNGFVLTAAIEGKRGVSSEGNGITDDLGAASAPPETDRTGGNVNRATELWILATIEFE
jgi:hypothetical protein